MPEVRAADLAGSLRISASAGTRWAISFPDPTVTADRNEVPSHAKHSGPFSPLRGRVPVVTVMPPDPPSVIVGSFWLSVITTDCGEFLTQSTRES